MKKAWTKLFAVVQQIKKAVAVREWNPLNCACLSHPEIAMTKTRFDSETSIATDSNTTVLDTLNTDGVQIGGMMDAIVQHALKKGGANRRSRQLAAGRSIKQAIESSRKATAGVLVGQGHFCLDDEAIEALKVRKAKADSEEEARKNRKKNIRSKHARAIKEALDKSDDLSGWKEALKSFY